MASDVSVQDFILLAYKAFDEEMKGKTLLQKRVYFLSIMVGEDLGYRAHYYGPYSEEVATGNVELKSMGFLEEDIASYGGVDSRGFERARHDYKMTELGKRVANQVANDNADLWNEIKSAKSKLASGGDLDYMSLSIAAKAYYILEREGGSATLEKIKELLPKFNWSVNDTQLNDAAEFLKKTKLVSQ